MKVKKEKNLMPLLFILILSLCWRTLMLLVKISNQIVTFDSNNRTAQLHTDALV